MQEKRVKEQNQPKTRAVIAAKEEILIADIRTAGISK